MDNFNSDILQLIVNTESIFNNVIVEDKVYNEYFEPGTRFLKFYNEFSISYDYQSAKLNYRNLNDPHYWNEEFSDNTNKEIIASGFRMNETQTKVANIELPKDIINKLKEMTGPDFDYVTKLCKLIYTKNSNVGYDQLVRSTLIVSDFDKVKIIDLISGKFMKDPRDVLVYAHNKSKGMNYGIELFI